MEEMDFKPGKQDTGEPGTTFYPVVIIGSGLSGVAAGCRLKKKLGCNDFLIVERYDGIGGTWWIHRYPGVACDVPATLYSYSFAQTGRWSTLKPSGKEICDYIRRVCEEHGLADNIQLNTEATDLRWDELREEWQITLARLVPGTGSLTQSERKTKVAAEGPESIYISREVARAKVVISAVGKFVEPRIELSHLPGFDRFEGEIIHTSRWNGDVDLRGKEIIVLGTGCSAAQLVPELGRARYGVKSITQLMRSPPWVGTEMLSPRLLGLWERHMPWLLQNVPGLKEAVRFIICAVTEFHYFLYIQPTAQASIRRQKQAKYLLRRMESLAPAGYHEILTPGYEVGCKRLIRDPKWLRSLQEPKVNLLDMELIRIAEAAVILESRDQDRPAQIRRPADVIILATGYENDTLLAYITVKGRNGIDLHMQWSDRGGLQAYLGLAVDNFPNLFFLNGPNTSSSHTSILITIENALHYVLKRIKPVLRGEVSSWEVHEETCKRWTYQVQRASKAGVWVGGGCTSWYVNEKGWNAMVYPFSQLYSTYRAVVPTWEDWAGWTATYTAKGICRQRRRRTAAGILLFLLVVLCFSSPAFLNILSDIPGLAKHVPHAG